MLTGFHPGTPERLQLGPGLLLKDFCCDAAQDAAQLRQMIAAAIEEGSCLLGATQGGGVFACTPMLRSLEQGAMRTAQAAATVNDGWLVQLTGTLLEVTPDHLSMLLPGARKTSTGSVTSLTVQDDLRMSDYLPRLCWIGDTPRGFVLIELSHALSMAGATLAFQAHGEGTLPFLFQAHHMDWDEEGAPFRMLFFDEVSA